MSAIPQFLSHLKVYGEYPVPFIVKWVNGIPDFRVNDSDKWDRCAKERLCSICGYKLGEIAYIVGGPATANSRMFFDPAMHEPCVEFAAQVCPYVSGKKREYSDRPITEGTDILDDVQDRNPTGLLYIFKVRTSKLTVVEYEGHLLFKAQQFIGRREVKKSAKD